MLVFSVAGNPINANISYHAPISHRRKLGAEEHTDSAITNATELLQHLVLRTPEPVLKKNTKLKTIITISVHFTKTFL